MSQARTMQLVIAAVVMSMTGVAQAAVPVAYDGKALMVKDEAIYLRMHFYDADGGNRTLVVVSNPAHGTLSEMSPGSMAYGFAKYTPDAGYTGTDSFTWKINDGTGDSNVATTRVLVREANDRAGMMVLLVVRDTLLPNIQSGINQLMADLQNEGYTAKTIPFTVPAVNGELKLYNAIAAEYDNPSQFVTGAILIGNLPRAKNKENDQVTDLVYWTMKRWFGNEDTWRDISGFNSPTNFYSDIWVSRIHASGVHPFNMPAGGEAELTLRALQNNHDYRTGASRYPHRVWYANYVSSGFLHDHFSLVWPTVAPAPGSIIDVLRGGCEVVNSTAHGEGTKYDYGDGHYYTSIYSIYESPFQNRFNVVESCSSGYYGGVVQQMPFTRGGGNIFAVGATATTYVFSLRISPRDCNYLAGGDSWGGSMRRYGAFPTVNDRWSVMFYGDLSTGVKVAPENQVPEIGAMTASVTSGVVPVTVNFSASASDPDGSIANYEWWPYGYQGGSIEPISSGSSSTSYTFTKAHRYRAHLEVVDNYKARAYQEVELAFAPDSTQPMRFDCDNFDSSFISHSQCLAFQNYRKDGDYTDSQGNLWLHDQRWMAGTWGRTTGSSGYSTSNSITGTNDPYLYQQARQADSITYRVPVNNGAYILKVHFADINSTAAGKCVMDIDVEGATVVTGLDVYSVAGPRTVYIVTQPVTITDGELTLIVKKSAGATAPAFISAFEVLPDGENQPPTVQIAASANPNPTAGTTTALSVLGADDMGESNLTYTWETTGEPPAAVSFNVNNSNAAKNTTATFSEPGTYNFQVTIKDSGNLTCTSSIEVAVIEPDPPVLTTIVVTPSSASVSTGQTQQFTAVGRDQYGDDMSPQPTFSWSVSGGGTINGSGLFTAGATAGGPYTVTAGSGGVEGTAGVTVTESAPAPVLTTIVVTPSNANVSTGGTQQFTAVGKDQYGADLSVQPTFSWSVGGGGTISGSGLFTAGATPGGPYTVTATCGGVEGTASVTVTGSGSGGLLVYEGFNYGASDSALHGLGGNSPGFAEANKWNKYHGNNADYKAAGLTFSNLKVTGGSSYFHGSGNDTIAARQITNGLSGTVWGSYLFKAAVDAPSSQWNGIGLANISNPVYANAWEYVVSFACGASPAVAMKTITYGTDAGSFDNTVMMMLFKMTNVSASGATITAWILTADQFAYWKATGLDSLATNTPVGTGSSQVWGRVSKTGGTTSLGTAYIGILGFAMASHFDELRLGETADSVTPTMPVLTTIAVTPPSASVDTGETQLFTAIGKDQYGEDMLPQPTFNWSVNGGGTINESGLFTAGSTPGGPYTVTASADSISGTAQVTVTEVLVLTTIVVTPSSASVNTGETQLFTAVGKDQHGADLSPQPTFNWNVSGGGTINSAGLFTAGSTAGGPYTVTASCGGVEGTASVTVTGGGGGGLLAYEGFDYGDSDSALHGLGGNSPGFAEANKWNKYHGNNADYKATGLTFSNLSVTGGSSYFHGSGSDTIATRQITNGLSGTVWGSYLFKAAVDAPSSQWNGIGLANISNPVYANAWEYVVSFACGASPAVAMKTITYGSDSGSFDNTVMMVLFKLTDVGASGSTITEWILTADQFTYWKAAGLDALAANTPVGTGSSQVWGRASKTGGTTSLGMAYIGILGFAMASHFDELRLGETADSVTPTVGGEGQAAAPTFDPPAGVYSSDQAVAIGTATDGATICYTTDGSTPSRTNGTVYSGPVNIPAMTELKAIAYGDAVCDSPVSRWIYARGSDFGVAVVGQYVFYNQSYFDGNDAAASAADDAAIATDKSALRPGGQASLSNYTSYNRGLNGIMVDILSPPGTPTKDDFAFKVGNSAAVQGWAAGPPPISVTVRRGGGAGGSDRVTLLWLDNVIQNQWLQVTVLPTAATGLSANHVFYFGNIIGETGDSTATAMMDVADQSRILANPKTPTNRAAVDDRHDINRDGLVNATDVLAARKNTTSPARTLILLTAP